MPYAKGIFTKWNDMLMNILSYFIILKEMKLTLEAKLQEKH